MSRVTFALAKGRLATKTLEILEKINIKPVDLTDDSRKLLFNSRVRDKPTLYGVSSYALEDMYNNIDFKGEKKWI